MRESYRILFILLLFAIIFILGRCSCDGIIDSQPRIRVDTLYQERIDTIHLTHEITKYKPLPSKRDTIYLEKANEVEQHIHNTYESDGSYQDTTCLPPTRVDYHLAIVTDNYDVDSIDLKFNIDYPKVTQTQTITKEITKYKTKRLGFTLGGGVGYNGKVDYFIGLIWGIRF